MIGILALDRDDAEAFAAQYGILDFVLVDETKDLAPVVSIAKTSRWYDRETAVRDVIEDEVRRRALPLAALEKVKTRKRKEE